MLITRYFTAQSCWICCEKPKVDRFRLHKDSALGVKKCQRNNIAEIMAFKQKNRREGKRERERALDRERAVNKKCLHHLTDVL